MKRASVWVAISLVCVVGCKKKGLEKPAVEILSAEVDGAKNLTVRFVLLDDAGKRKKGDGELTATYQPAGSPGCRASGGRTEFVDEAGGPVGVAKYTLSSPDCVQRTGFTSGEYFWRLAEMEDDLPVTVFARKVVVPTFFGGTGAPVDVGAQKSPPVDAMPVASILDQTIAELSSLVPLIPEADPAAAAEKCAPEVIANMRLVDYDLVTSFSTGTPIAELELLRQYRRDKVTHPRETLSEVPIWLMGYRKWGMGISDEETTAAGILDGWTKPVTWAFVRVQRYTHPEYAEHQHRKYTPGVLAATIFVVDPTAKKILCRAPLRAQQEGTLRVVTDDRNTMNDDFIGRINGALTAAKVAMGGAPPPAVDAGLPLLPDAGT